MKVINKTRKYLHVRMTNEEFAILEKGLKKVEREKQEEKERLEYATWFYTNHIDISWQDEYSSWHTDWKNIHTRETVGEPSFEVRMYQHRFKTIMDKNKKKLGYKD